MNGFESLLSKGQEILALARKRGARHLRVSGSKVKGMAHSDSDVDFLVDLQQYEIAAPLHFTVY
jgi:predicted nucleotidyltransferase